VKNKGADINQDQENELIAIIRDRRSVRSFLDKDVPHETVFRVLEAARMAPSGVNTQPWHVAVIGKKHRRIISEAIIQARESQIPENPDYHYYPEEWFEPYKSRRKACGLALYSAVNIQIHETEKRKVQWYKNYYFFNAPLALIFYLDSRLCKGSWVDMGMFIQNVMLGARCFGLETCPQAALAEYPDIIREHLQIANTMHIVCGMAMGYADWSDPVNQYRTTREEVDTFTVWHD
jgi:nitroreductase